MAGTYRTISGETWDMIAYRALGDGMLMHEMIAANPEYCETFIFKAGVVLQIPDVETSESSTGLPWFTT